MERKTDTPANRSNEDDWCALNALADGELRPDQQVETAYLVASMPAAGAALGSIVALKRHLGDLTLPPAEGALPPRTALKPPAISAYLGAVAASVVLLVLVVGLIYRPLPTAQADFVAAALAVDPTAPSDRAPIAPVLQRVAGAVEENLASVGLIRHWRLQEASGFVHVGFGGPRGCRLSVHIGPADAVLATERLNGRQAAAWQATGHTVIVLATSMPAERFAAAVTLVRSVFDEDTPQSSRNAARTLLVSAWRDARPCLG